MSRERSFSQTKVLNLKKNPNAEKIKTEAIQAPQGDYTNYNQVARKFLGLFIHRTSFFSHLMITGIAASVLLSSIWSGSGAVLADRSGDQSINQGAVPLAVASVASATNLRAPVAPTSAPATDGATAEGGFLQAPSAPNTDRKASVLPESYTVKAGETIASIAGAHGISQETVLWANGLKQGASLRPGQTLTLIPVSGVIYDAQGGETLEQVATRYHADVSRVIAANEVDQDRPLTAGVRIVIPGGTKDAGSTAQPITTTNSTAVATRASTGSSRGNTFPWGWCTWYAASRRDVPWIGNAGEWYWNAQAMGYPVGKTPRAGAIYVSWENPYYGHVAYVESVNSDGSYVISEMNYVGFGVVNTRTISPGQTSVIGFIY